MKNIRFQLAALIIALFAIYPCYGQSKKNSHATFRIKIARGYVIPDSITATEFKGVVGMNYEKQDNWSKQVGEREFEINIPLDQKITPLTFYISNPNGRSATTNTYYVEKGDKIDATLFNDGVNEYGIQMDITGQGSSKYHFVNGMMQLQKIFYAEQDSLMRTLFGNKMDPVAGKVDSFVKNEPSVFKANMSMLKEKLIEAQRKEMDMVNIYRAKISPSLAAFIGIELGCYAGFNWTIQNLGIKSKEPNTKKALASYYFANLRDVSPNISNPYISYALNYKHNRSMEIQSIEFFRSGGKPYPFKTLYELTKKTENAKLRETLLTSLFVKELYSLYSNELETRDSLLLDAITNVTDSELKTALNIQKVFMKGSPVYDFSFPDTTGNLVSLKDLRGKVFMLDMSGTGCAPCVMFAKRFGLEVYPEFINNPNFKIISLNLDDTRARWISAIKSGLYTQKGAIELNAGRDPFDGPLMKHYMIKSVPFIILVDKEGRLISRLNEMSISREISDMIRTALSEPMRASKKAIKY